MQNLNATFERTQAFSMIGRAIDAAFPHPVTGEWVELGGAVVTGVTSQGSSTFVTVIGSDGNFIDVPLQSVTYVGDVTSNMTMPSDLVGRFVQAIIVNGDNAEFVEGRVDSIKMQGNQVILVVGTQEIFFPHEVHSVADEMLLIGQPGFTHGVVERVEISNNQAFLHFNTGSRVRVDRINQATEALAFVRHQEFISHGDVFGVVQSVTINSAGIPMLNVMQGGVPRSVNMVELLLARASGRGPTAESGE
jgi:hypothetical protein